MKKKLRKIGDVVKIPLDDEFHGYARVLRSGLFAFYKLKTRKEIPLTEVLKEPVLFKVCVMEYAISDGRWEVLGNYPLEDPLKEHPLFFKQDPISKKIYLYNDLTGEEILATKEDCVGLERASVWDPEHVEERLRDFFDGRLNRWVELQKLK